MASFIVFHQVYKSSVKNVPAVSAVQTAETAGTVETVGTMIIFIAVNFPVSP